MITLKQIVVSAPPELRETLHPLDADQALLKRCRGWPVRYARSIRRTASAKHPLRALARRWFALSVEIVDHDRHLGRRRSPPRPRRRCVRALASVHDTAAEMLIIFGEHPRSDSFGSRLRQALRGLPHPGFVRDDDGPPPPLPRRSSTGYRGELHRAVIVRMRYHSPTLNDVERRTAEGRCQPHAATHH